jgi:hypothetical protein
MDHIVPMDAPETPDTDAPARWLLLIHQLPAKPAYLRVKVWRRLQALGAVTVKNSVYALPASEQAQEDFEWLLKEVIEGGGEGLICEARLIDGLSDEEVRTMFSRARDADYDALAKEARSLGELLAADTSPLVRADARAKLVRLKADAGRIVALDFFGANGRETLDGLLATLDALVQENGPMAAIQQSTSANRDGGALAGRVWVTRAGVHVDRIASAWLIRRFIDPQARFKFVPAKGYAPELGELRFDMFEAEFTHEGDRCTFEVLLARAGLTDPALAAIAEIVHDIDLKDAKFGRAEASGIAHLIEGLSAANQDDQTRIERGAAMLDDLYGYFRAKRD